MKAKSLRQRVRDRIEYERSFTLAERWERGKEKLAQHIAWNLLPRRVRQWVVVRAHATVCAPDQHPDTVSAFDLHKANEPAKRALAA